ncbi:matrix-remodeling-associated protein 5 [Lampris incognitus]|uniref:matrix-remodeling-associated protein 5 n=1 Tax=Lampris incognitus TaxID=2546036 RepID=UPI0024B4B907|nr:matrix-remodeling-associated protein 5 [Lampris incognitus]
MDAHPAARVVVVLLLPLLVAALPPGETLPCPRPCSCPLPTELHCTFRSLATVPRGISKQTERINLGFNTINRITDGSLAGLGKLELLMVHGNNIHSLPNGAFRDLTSLQMLKMSYNKLSEINRYTLEGLWALARLHLDHNRLEYIHPDAFQGLTSLRLVQLEGNRLQQLHPATFATFSLMDHFHISTLRHLYLSENGLMSLPSRLLATMPQLENLYLHGNPWTCDCQMSWLHDWDKNSPGVLKCKKDRAYPGGQLCPMCSSPKHLRRKELLGVENMVCSSPVISSLHRGASLLEDSDSELTITEEFKEPFGNITLALSDEHGNKVDLECSIGEPRQLTKLNWEQVDQLQLASNVTLAADLECPIDRENYERLWRLIAYYSDVPAHLQREIMLTKEPRPIYRYRQDMQRDALYYTGVKVNIKAQPEWLMQTSVDLQLNRPQSSGKTVWLILRTHLSEIMEVELVRRQKRMWVMIESVNTTRMTLSAMVGSSGQMNCNVQSAGQAVIRWVLPDGSIVEAPYSSPDNRLSVSSEGQLFIKTIDLTDAGIYYCTAKVHGDFAILSFRLAVQESSSPPPGDDGPPPPMEGFAGEPITLPCTASGSPDADISWILPGSSIVGFRENSSRVLVYPNGTLQILQGQISDSGYYKCVAVNQNGVDTMAIKVTVNKRTGMLRTMRKFPMKPQSASGINTKIQVPMEDAVEASGDHEVTKEEATKSRMDLLRRRGPNTGRKRGHPSRNKWRRPPVLQKPTTSRVLDGKSSVDTRRRINVSNHKIDPEKWADILAKIRDRTTQNSTTPNPVGHNTERRPKVESERKTQSTLDDLEGSSEDDAELQGEDKVYTTTPRNSAEHTQQTNDIDNIHPTSVPQSNTTRWQMYTNNVSSSVYYDNSLQEDISSNTDVEAITTSETSKASDKTKHSPSVVSSSATEKESQLTPTMTTTKTESDRGENSKYFGETATFSSHPQPEHSTQDILHSQARITTAFPTTKLVPTLTTSKGSRGEGPNRPRRPNSKRRNGGRRKRPNGRKQKLNRLTQFITSTPVGAPLATTKTTAPTMLKMEPTEKSRVTAASSSTAVPFSGSQDTSLSRLSHKENTVSRHDDKAATEASSLPSTLPETEDGRLTPAKPHFKNPSTTPPFLTISPGVGHGETSSQEALGISESASPSERSPLPVKPLEETQRVSVTGDIGPVPHSDKSPETSHAPLQVQTHVEQSQQGHRYQPSDTTEKVPFRELDGPFPLQPSFLPAPSLPPETSRSLGTHVPSVLITTTGILDEEVSETEQNTTLAPAASESTYLSSGQIKITNTISDNEEPPTETAYRAVSIAAPTMSTSAPTVSASPTSNNISKLSAVIPHTETSHITITSTSSAVQKSGLPSGTTSQEGLKFNHIPDGHNERAHRERDPHNTSRSESNKATASHPATHSTSHRTNFVDYTDFTSPAPQQSNRLIIKQNTTAAPTTASTSRSILQTDTSRAHIPIRESQRPGTGTPVLSQDMSRGHQRPGQVSPPRGKPRIMSPDLHTVTVKAETDAHLPCEAVGEPMPFLSWTKASTGASIAQNTRVQRFEVHPNGTLIIHNTQPMDRGQYLCTVQNQYGTDKMVVSLVVLSQHPRVLQPRYHEATVYLGDDINLDCQVQGHPTPRVTWVLPDQVHMVATLPPTAPQQRVVLLTNGTLRITQASHRDRGIYKCIGSSMAGADTVSVRLHVATLPPVIQQARHENATLPEGSAAYFHCTAKGAPPPVIRWMMPDGVQLMASQFMNERNLLVFPNGTLYMHSIGPGNAGRYECTASNGVAVGRRTVILGVRKGHSSARAKIVSSSPQRTDVIYGGKLRLDCLATGKPEPRIIWRTPTKKLVDAQYSFDSRIKVNPNGTLTIHSMSEKDSGEYLCAARNKMGDDYVLLRVNVLTRPAKIEHKQQRSSQEVAYGGHLKVDCVASGFPDPEISWALPDGTMVNSDKQLDRVGVGRNRRYVVFDNGTLYFNDVGMREEGDYTCYAENQLGKDEMKVRVKVKVAADLPQIQDRNFEVFKVFYGETVTLKCNAKGNPKPVITWMSPTNRAIFSTLGKYQTLNNGTLVVQKAQRSDGGNYTCIAWNSAGQDRKATRLEVLVTPPTINGLRGSVNTISMTAVQNQRKLLDCSATGTPLPRVMWILPENIIFPVPYYSSRMTVHNNGTLDIRSPKRKDSGQLACIARNEGGEARLMVKLDVKDDTDRPQIGGPQTDSLSLTVGNTMTLNCSFEGTVQPHVTWILPNGTPLLGGSRVSKFFHRLDGSLIISNPSVAEAGTYRCLRHSAGGLIEHTVTLTPGRKPEINNKYNSPISIMNGENFLLHCISSGEPLRLTWTLPSGVVLGRPQRAGRYSVLPNGTLAIQQVSLYDRGSYVCQTANEYGSALLSVPVIVIGYPPRITNGPPSVTHAKRGVAIQLNCVATGTPKAELAWETPDKTRMAVSAQPRLFGNKYLQPQGSLIIQNPTQKDAGFYRCTARNTIGVDSKATYLNVF